jgi:hypothetical protein
MVTDGSLLLCADLQRDWSGLPAALIPKLIVRVRFPSPALTAKAQVRDGSQPGPCLLAILSGLPGH